MTIVVWSPPLEDLNERSRSYVIDLQSSEMGVLLDGQRTYMWSLIKAVFENESKKDFSLFFSLFSTLPAYSLFVPYSGFADARLHCWSRSEGKCVEGVGSYVQSSKRNIELRLMWSDFPGSVLGFELPYNGYLSISEYVKTGYKYAILLRSLPSLLL